MFWNMLRLRLRRDRWQLIVWGVVHFLLAFMVANAVHTTYGTAVERANTIKVMMVTPAILVFRGTPQGGTAGDMMALLGLTFIALIVILQMTFLVVRYTRAEEERGQTETLASTAAGRWTPTFAVIALGVIASVIASVALALGSERGHQDRRASRAGKALDLWLGRLGRVPGRSGGGRFGSGCPDRASGRLGGH